MNVTCTGCPAKYSVPDEKVRGKKVRITCKHCGTQIVIDGHALGPSPSVLPEAARSASRAPGPKGVATTSAATVKPPAEQTAPVPAKTAAPESSWLVGYTDERQEQHTSSGLVELYATGKLGDALVWKDGMTDWASPFDVPELAAALRYQSVPARPRTYSGPSPGDDDPTIIGRSMFSDTASASSALEKSLPDAQAAPSPPHERAVEINSGPSAVTGAVREPSAQILATRQSSPELKPTSLAARQSSPEVKPTARPARQSSPELKPGTLAALQINADRKAATLPLRQSNPEFKPKTLPSAGFEAGTPSALQFSPESPPQAEASADVSSEFSPASHAAPAPTASEAPFTTKPLAARRAEKQAAGVDLFASPSGAGGETESLDFNSAEPLPKLTGARNESSVLFSLDALTKPAPKTDRSTAHQKEREEQATAALFDDESSGSLINVGGGGFAALSAPDFTKPVSSAPEPAPRVDPLTLAAATPAKKRGATVFGFIVALIVLGAAAAFAFVFIKKPVPEPHTESVATGPSTMMPNATTSAAAQAAETSGASEASSAAPIVSGSASAVAPAASSSVAPTAGSANLPAVKPSASSSTTKALAQSAPTDATRKAEPSKPEGAPPTEAPAVTEFDKSAAVVALNAAAASAASCKKPDGPTGTGKASVTFSPTGRATNSTVTGAFAGTEVGGCVARAFRSAKVPAFSGDPVTVSKSFSIE